MSAKQARLLFKLSFQQGEIVLGNLYAQDKPGGSLYVSGDFKLPLRVWERLKEVKSTKSLRIDVDNDPQFHSASKEIRS